MSLQVHFSSALDRWATPRDVYQALDDEFCFDFDPCPLDGTEDGLATLYTRWDGRRVFCNPPYGPGLAKWLERGLEANLAVFLIPARTDTRWFHDIVLPKAKEIRFIKGRLKFGDAVNAAPFPSMIVVFKYFDDYEEDPIECEPGEISICRECKGKGGWRVCGTPTIQTPNGDRLALHRREEK